MKVACAGCRESFESADLKDVGSHLFCATCFDNLLKPASVEQPAPLELTFESSAQEGSSAHEAAELCFVCQESMPDGPHTNLGGLGICLSCREGLTLRVPEDESVTASQEAEVAAQPPGPTYTPGSASCSCAGCGRMMPGPGSFHEVDGASFCPDCFYKRAETAAVEDNTMAPAPAQGVAPATAGAGESCDACLRPLVHGCFDLLSGFRICRACTSSNEALALGIARVRHERYLQELAKALT